MRAVCIALSLFTVVLLSGRYAAAAETVRVLVVDDMKGLEIHFPGPYEVQDRSGMGVVKEAPSGKGFDIVLDEDTPGEGIRLTASGFMIRINEYSLTGVIEVTRNKRGLYRLVNELDLEDYVRAVVGFEMNPGWNLEALKAQAVTARTYVLYRKSMETCEDYDLCSTVNSQMFKGDAITKDGPARAAKETEGLVLYYGGRLAEAVYHSSCGGLTEDSFAVWNNAPPYLQATKCDCRKQSPYASWTRVFSVSELERLLKGAGYRADGIRSVEVSRKSGTGRAAVVSVETASKRLDINGNEFRKALGYSRLPSTLFVVAHTAGGFEFKGRGSGHGVGMCQWGAKVMAENGRGFREILAHYYPKAKLVDIRAAKPL